MECSESQDAAQCTVATPSSRGCDGDHASHVVLVVVNVQAEWAVEELVYRVSRGSRHTVICSYIFNELTKSTVSSHQAFRTSNNIVAVGQQTSGVGGRVRDYVEDVPDSFSCRER